MESNLQEYIKQATKGISGMLEVANDKLTQAKEAAKTDEQKKEFAKEFIASGLLNELNNLQNKINELSKCQ